MPYVVHGKCTQRGGSRHQIDGMFAIPIQALEVITDIHRQEPHNYTNLSNKAWPQIPPIALPKNPPNPNKVIAKVASWTLILRREQNSTNVLQETISYVRITNHTPCHLIRSHWYIHLRCPKECIQEFLG